ncbi:glutamate--tRNA ligase family protein [Serratia ureilytica]
MAALGSYLQARAQRGQWLVRIEDIDPPREVPGAAARILSALEHYGLHWDGQVIYQSQRHDAYRAALDLLQRQGSAITAPAPAAASSKSADCTTATAAICSSAHRAPPSACVRPRPFTGFTIACRENCTPIRRWRVKTLSFAARDGLFAYNLAVVIDDHFQGVTEIVRGADLIEPTVRQIALYRQLQAPVPAYVHLPLALGANGIKLSKQNHAPALPAGDPRPVLIAALKFLRQPLPESWQDLDLPLLLSWAIEHWRLENVPRQEAIPLDENTPAFSKEPW